MSAPQPDLPDIVKRNKVLQPGESFRFGCHPGVPCFNRCCADVNILLTPVDVLQLARRTGLSTREFLDRHTLVPITKDLHLPVLMLRMGPEPEKRCPFSTPAGCGVYQDRPWACRMYPVGMAIPPARAGFEPQPMYFLFQDDYCQGRGEPQEWTVDSWRADQGVPKREAMEAGFREIVSHPWFIGGRTLDPKRMDMFLMACYDLDTFREFVFGTTFLDRFVLDDTEVERLRGDDAALLSFAFRWLRFALFGEPTMTLRNDTTPSGRTR